MFNIAIVRLRDRRCEQWHIDSRLKPGLAPILGQKLVSFEVMQGQAVVPVRQMAVWAGAAKNLVQCNVEILDAPTESLSLWYYSHVAFFADACNIQKTLRLANACAEMGIHTLIASGAPEVYRQYAHDIHEDITWCGFDAAEFAQWLGAGADGIDEIAPDWKASRVGDYCPYFVPVSLASHRDGQIVARELTDIMDEIHSLRKTGVLTADKKIIFDSPFEDQSLAAHQILSLAKALVTEDLQWSAWIPANEQGFEAMDIRDIALLRRSGMILAWLGKSMDFYAMMHDGSPRYISADFVRQLKSRGIAVAAEITLGDDSRLCTAQQARAILASGVDMPAVALQTPYPETPLFAQMQRENRMTTYDWSLYDGTRLVYQPTSQNALYYEQEVKSFRHEMISPFTLLSRLFKPCLLQIQMMHYSSLSMTESAALRFALASSSRNSVLNFHQTNIPRLASVILVGKY